MKRTYPFVVIALLLAGTASAQTPYSLTKFPDNFACPTGMGSDGLVLELYKSELTSAQPPVAAGSSSGFSVAELATTSLITDLGAPTGQLAEAAGVNASGDIAGQSWGAAYARLEALPQKWIKLAPDINGVTAQGAAMAINDSGLVCGYSETLLDPAECDPNSPGTCKQYRAFQMAP